jgi:hypothetical protein
VICGNGQTEREEDASNEKQSKVDWAATILACCLPSLLNLHLQSKQHLKPMRRCSYYWILWGKITAGAAAGKPETCGVFEISNGDAHQPIL